MEKISWNEVINFGALLDSAEETKIETALTKIEETKEGQYIFRQYKALQDLALRDDLGNVTSGDADKLIINGFDETAVHGINGRKWGQVLSFAFLSLIILLYVQTNQNRIRRRTLSRDLPW